MNFRIVELWAVVLMVDVAAALAITIDAVMRKRHVASIVGWVGLVWLAPILGAILYLCFGINRIERSAAALNLKAAWASGTSARSQAGESVHPAQLDTSRHPGLAGLARLGQQITGNPLLAGNQVELLRDGDDAYPVMLDAIESARKSIALLSYIFDSDPVGDMFLGALARAAKRGVQVRVLIDGVGARYTRPTMVQKLREADIRVAAFLPTSRANVIRYINLRNHRKILVVDGTVGFTGGMNIREGHLLSRKPVDPVQCLHFRVKGPVVADLQRTFAVDWAFTAGEHLDGGEWFPRSADCGTVAARGVADGPDAQLDNIVHVMLGALATAARRVRIVTPYFLPNDSLLQALQITAMRGIEVDIVLPSKSNIRVMDWAMTPQLPFLLERGCRVYFTPPPFDHTKLMVVDGCWALIGSTNWDARSLRLNFEYNLECYDELLAGQLEDFADSKIAGAHRLRLDDLLARPFGVRLRDRLARLLSPYL